MAAASSTWPTRRCSKDILRTITATIFTEEIDSAVPQKSAVIKRELGLGNSTSAEIRRERSRRKKKPKLPNNDAVIAGRRTLLTTARSVSMPVSSNSIMTPNWATASIMLCCLRGREETVHVRPMPYQTPGGRDTSKTPANSWPMMAG